MLHEAAGQFVVSASPESSVACIAGFPWLGIRTRDALIGFTGLLLIPGRLKEARNLLFALASQMQKGLMPSEFPEDSSAPTLSLGGHRVVVRQCRMGLPSL